MTTRESWVATATPAGTLWIASDGVAITEARFLEGAPEHDEAAPRAPVLARAVQQVAEYVGGSRTAFDLPLAPAGTAFQRAVWAELSRVGCGETRSYAEVARRLGRPAAVRAVGAANGRNPIALFIPCHRIVGADGSLTGYAYGLDRKRALLEHERRCGREAGP
jgi:methylated-DNA-[protein]-cysteine S-methyltransferase